MRGVKRLRQSILLTSYVEQLRQTAPTVNLTTFTVMWWRTTRRWHRQWSYNTVTCGSLSRLTGHWPRPGSVRCHHGRRQAWQCSPPASVWWRSVATSSFYCRSCWSARSASRLTTSSPLSLSAISSSVYNLIGVFSITFLVTLNLLV